MKQNGNHAAIGDYYIGLDVGTTSVGWAVTDKQYNISKFKGNAMWGARLFDEAQPAAARRSSRTARRRLARRKQRLLFLEMLFAEELNKVDESFLMRMSESALWPEDKSDTCPFSLFGGKDYTDKDYHRQYPTVYHLRNELVHSAELHDIRLVYLALHHIMKSRGHFLYADSNDGEAISVEAALSEFSEFVFAEYGISFEPAHREDFIAQLISGVGVTAKKKLLKAAADIKADDEAEISTTALLDLLAGATVKLSELYRDEELKSAEIKSVCLKNDLDEVFDELSELLGDRVELIPQAKRLFDTARLSSMLNGHKYISEAKVELYEQNKADLKLLKSYVRKAAPEQYKHIFSEKSDKLANYAAYTDGECKQEDFCKFLKSVLPEPDDGDPEVQRIYARIKDGTLLTRLKGSDNGVIPYQLHKNELTEILKNAERYLPFLKETDEAGLSVSDKIIKTFEFRLPYYVGPLNPVSPNGWAVRFPEHMGEKVYPWNFEKVIDTEESAACFIENLIGRCTYTGEKVLPKDSLLYSEYALLNEMNLLRIDGKPLPIEDYRRLLDELFYKSKKKVTKKRIRSYLLAEGLIEEAAVISGVDDNIKSSLKSYHDFKSILERTGDADMVEDIIRSILIFGDDKKMLRRWLSRSTHDLTDDDIKYICRLKYSDWGRLSKVFLTGIYSPDEWGEAKSIIDWLRLGERNLMQLMSNDFEFAAHAAEHAAELFGTDRTLGDKLDDLYIAPSVRRSIRQTLRIVDEIVDIKKSVPEKIFIEVARENADEMNRKRTESRKDQLITLYKSCKEDSGELFERLENEDENSLRSDKLFLYYTQLGRCMYSGEPIDFGALSRGEMYDIDHIFPQSKVKDNSIDNRVLVKNGYNREKTNIYPINESIRTKMRPMWDHMKKQGLISQKKYDRLIRSFPLTDAELEAFVARQLVETRQSTKALAGLLKDILGEKVRIVYSKAGNVSDFRHDSDFIKCREVNDLHHAKDAYLNIVVGNVYDTRFTKRFFANIRNENYSLNKVFAFDTKDAWDTKTSMATVKKYMAKNNVIVTRMPREVKGQLFDLQLMPAGKGQLEKKSGLPIDKYGGYNKLSGAYFCLVEHTEKKKRIRTLEPVYVYKKQQFEADPEEYCRQTLGLTEPKVIVKRILIDSLLELNGQRLYVNGRTGERLIFKHSYQLTLGYEWEKYIKQLQKYSERCYARRTELPLTDHDGITRDKNEELYDLFIEKCGQKVYAELFGNMRADMEKHHEKFSTMSELGQVNLLLEVLKAFRCNAQKADFTNLCGKGSVGILVKSKAVSKLDSAYLVNRSVTGLYETKVDLLK